jgi:hypothetical protein
MGVALVLVAGTVFKTAVSGRSPDGWVRFPDTPAKQLTAKPLVGLAQKPFWSFDWDGFFVRQRKEGEEN